MDLFRRQNAIVTNKRNSDFVQPTMNSMNPQSYGSDSIIKNHFTLIHVYGPLNTDNDYVYQPIQAKQHCYRFVYICASFLLKLTCFPIYDSDLSSYLGIWKINL